jgi:nucleotide-binding universal stress UspA family protein
VGRYRKILVAYDGSGSSGSALKAASAIALEEKSWVKVVAVVPSYDGDLELVGVSNIRDAITGPGRKILDGAKAAAEEEGLSILTDLEQGEPYERIVSVADDEKCDLIVMGRQGSSHLERELMGSVTARVIGHTKKDVLVVPQGTDISWESVLFATDGSPRSEEAAALALDLAETYKSKLTIVRVVYTNDEFLALAPSMVTELVEKSMAALAGLKDRAAEKGISVETVVKEGEPYRAITALAEKVPASVIVMGSEGRRGLRKMLMGSVTEKVIGYAPCPVLVRHPGFDTR